MHTALIFCQSFIHYNITSYFQKPLPPTAKHTHTLTHKHQLPSSNLPKCSELILYHRYDYSNFAWAVILWHSIQAYGWIINPWKWMRALSGVFFSVNIRHFSLYFYSIKHFSFGIRGHFCFVNLLEGNKCWVRFKCFWILWLFFCINFHKPVAWHIWYSIIHADLTFSESYISLIPFFQ